MNRYNLALLPLHIGPQVLQLSREFSPFSDQYLLGKASFPHVTVCQFYAPEAELEGIWEKARQVFPEILLHLNFQKASTFVYEENLWIQLIPEPSPRLQDLHNRVAEIVKSPLGLVLEAYSPHMTLANIKKSQGEKASAQVATLKVKLADDFILALGNCDEVGQFTKILKQQAKATLTLNF